MSRVSPKQQGFLTAETRARWRGAGSVARPFLTVHVPRLAGLSFPQAAHTPCAGAFRAVTSVRPPRHSAQGLPGGGASGLLAL